MTNKAHKPPLAIGYVDYQPMHEGAAAEQQPHGGYFCGGQEINGQGLDGEREHPGYTEHHNYDLHRNRTLSGGGEHIREATAEDGVAFRVPMRADIEES